jgi:arginase family enzyme
MLDPMQRWREYGEKPDYAGPLTFGGVPCTQDPAELAGFDVAIVGAPMDELVSDRPGSRFAPRAIRAASCPPGPQLEAGVDGFAALRIVDYGDAAVVPAQPARSHGAIDATVSEVAGELQKSGFITYHRGRVTIFVRQALEAASCECYRTGAALLKAVRHPPPTN